MKILVTGGAGFIGSNFVRYAINKNHKIINIDKLTYAGNLGNLSEYINHPSHTFYKLDICNRKELLDVMVETKPDAIVHMAAESHVDRSIDCADDFISTNIVGTYNILECSLKYFSSLEDSTKKEKFKFLHLSTDEVFGSLGNDGKFNEQSPYKPNSPYSASKAASDLLVRSFFKTYKLPTLIANSSNNYGPNQYPEKLIPVVILNALAHKKIPVYGNGNQVRDWLYVLDHVEGLVKILEHGKSGEQYCIGGGNEYSNLDLIKKICVLLDNLKPSNKLTSYKELIMFVKDRPGHDNRYAIDSQKLRSVIGWTPKTSLDFGMQETIRWYIDNSTYLDKLSSRERIGLGK